MKTLGKFLFLAGLLVSVGSACADPREEMPGASQKEREIRWLWKHLGLFVESCHRAPDCVEPGLAPILEKLSKTFPPTAQSATSDRGRRLVFVSEAEHPELFRSDAGEAHRVAMTGLEPQSTIYINSDRMDLGNARWVGILVHETVHHLGIVDDSSRLPDRLGAAVASHVEKNWLESRLGEFGHAKMGLVLFNEPKGDRPVVSMFSAEEANGGVSTTVDQDLTVNALKPVCPAGKKLKGQLAGQNLWRIVDLRPDQGTARVRGSALIENFCADATGRVQSHRTNLISIVDLIFAEPFDAFSAWWHLSSAVNPTTLGVGFGDSTSDLVDLNRSFVILSAVSGTSEYLPGEIWRMRVTVKSTDAFVPRECGVFFEGSKWMFNRSANRKMFDVFHSCVLKDLGDGKWQVDASYTFPDAGQPDLFSLSMIYFSSGDEDRYAVPLRPQFVRFNNPGAAPPLSFKEWRVLGLDSAPGLMGSPLKNSYLVEYDRPFWIELDFSGGQSLRRRFFDFDFIVVSGIGAVVMPWNVPAAELGEMIVSEELVAVPGGVRLRYQLKLPRRMDGLVNLGFRLRRVSVETDDFAWAEMFNPGFKEAWFLTDELR